MMIVSAPAGRYHDKEARFFIGGLFLPRDARPGTIGTFPGASPPNIRDIALVAGSPLAVDDVSMILVRVHGSSVTVVQQRTRCGSIDADPAAVRVHGPKVRVVQQPKRCGSMNAE
jgi:hypothetical protein